MTPRYAPDWNEYANGTTQIVQEINLKYIRRQFYEGGGGVSESCLQIGTYCVICKVSQVETVKRQWDVVSPHRQSDTPCRLRARDDLPTSVNKIASDSNGNMADIRISWAVFLLCLLFSAGSVGRCLLSVCLSVSEALLGYIFSKSGFIYYFYMLKSAFSISLPPWKLIMHHLNTALT